MAAVIGFGGTFEMAVEVWRGVVRRVGLGCGCEGEPVQEDGAGVTSRWIGQRASGFKGTGGRERRRGR